MNFSEDSQTSTNLNSKKSLIRRLRKGHHVRTRFVESHLDKKLALQIRSLRGDLSQEEMEQKTGIKQQAISRLENPYYGKATLTTLKKFAAANDVGLLVEFVPFSELINRVSGTPYVERGYSPDTMNVPSFEEENKAGTFEQSAIVQVVIPGSPQTVNTSHSEELIRIYLLRGKGKSTGGRIEFKPANKQKAENHFLPFPPQGSEIDENQLRVLGGSR